MTKGDFLKSKFYFGLFILSLLILSACSPTFTCKTVTKEVSGCDKINGCTCIHKSFLGLGDCDTCTCEEGPLC
ncbi:hypothetical protein HYX05_03715 [Candidatus Woesearchaeota archaeon]|nr:hypothetical protein [Candidatus Woesearchaeota archaeon]